MTDAQAETEKGPSLREINQSQGNPLYKFRMITKPKQRFRIKKQNKQSTRKVKKTGNDHEENLNRMLNLN